MKTRRDEAIESLKHDLILLQKELAATRAHVLKLETDQPKQSKKQRLGEDMNEAMIEDSSNKDIEIQRLMNENELLKSTACEVNEKIKCATVTITEDAIVQTMEMEKATEIKEHKLKELQEKNDRLSLQHIETERKHKSETKKLLEQNKNIQTLLAECESTLDETLQKLNSDDQGRHCKEDNNSEKLLKLIETKLTNGLKTIQQNVESLISEKLSEKSKIKVNEDVDVAMQDLNDEPHTYATVVKDQKKGNMNNFRAIMMATKNEELAEEAERKARSTNIVIHGKEELLPDEDKLFVDNLMKEICVGCIHTTKIERIGKAVEDKNRPIKVTFNNASEKEKVMNNLPNLKGKPDFKGISIKEDLTLNERMMIKEFVNKAKEENAKEPSDTKYIWRVRGSPKNGLTIRRFKKATQDHTIEATK